MRQSPFSPGASALAWLLLAAACGDSDPAMNTVDAASQQPASDGGQETDGAPGGGASADGGGAVAAGDVCGWAAASGDGVATTTGGGDAKPSTVTSADELLTLAADPEPRVIQIQGVLDVPNLEVASNKTIIGLGPDSGINGGIRIRGASLAERVTNVIVRNLRVNAATALTESNAVASDGIQIYRAHHVWIDHCEVFDAPDGNLDVVHGSDNVTISWTVFHYTAAAPQAEHRFSNLIGHTDGNEEEDQGRLRVTFHHDWWSDGVVERMPRVRWGHVHALNNLYTAAGNNYCIAAAFNGKLVVENNAFAGVSDPNILKDPADPTGGLTAFGNQYDGTTGPENGNLGAAVPPLPDAYVACPTDPASSVAELVMAGAGPQ